MSKVISASKLGEVSSWKIPPVEQDNQIKPSEYSEGLTALCDQIPSIQDIENLKKETYDESYEEGYKKGLQEAYEESSNLLNLANDLLNQLSQPKEYIDQTIKQQLVDLSLAIARQVVSLEIDHDPKKLIHMIDMAITYLPDPLEKIFIHINPEDLKKIKTILIDKDSSKNWNFIEDENISSGGCKVFSENSSVDLSLDVQLAKIAAQIFDLETDSQEADTDET